MQVSADYARLCMSAWAKEQGLFLQNEQQFSHEGKEAAFSWLKNATFSILYC